MLLIIFMKTFNYFLESDFYGVIWARFRSVNRGKLDR